MTEPLADEHQWSQLFGVGVSSLVESAKRLGLTWRMTLGTVTEATSANSLKVQLDGDTASIVTVSIIGSRVIGTRVYVITVPPAGNYVIGQVAAYTPEPTPTRISTVLRTSASGAFTAETVVDTIVASLIANRTCRVVWYGRVQSTVADGYARGRIRENSALGTARQTQQAPTTIAAGQSQQLMMMFEYTPTVDETKTFVATITRQAGTGSLSSFAAADAPVYFYIEYVYG